MARIQKGVMFVFLMFVAVAANAVPHGGMWKGRSGVDKVVYPVTVQQWVSTQTAKVEVSVDATLKESDLSKARGNIRANLDKIGGKADWHITQFRRSQDQSGLERVAVQAEARLPEGQLANLRQQAKAMSKAGSTYRINNIDFTPSMADMQQARADLRAKVYMQANQELVRLNKQYPGQKFHLHRVNFVGMMRPGMAMKGARAMFVGAAMAASPTPLTVSNRLSLNAMVFLSTDAKPA